MVPLVAIKFREHATAWWKKTKFIRARQGKTKIVTWDKMKKHMCASFLRHNHTQVLSQRLQNLRQHTRSIDDYTEEFYELVARNDQIDSEDQLVSWYIGGMCLEFQDQLSMFDPIDVAEAHAKT